MSDRVFTIHVCPECGYYDADPILRRAEGIACFRCGQNFADALDTRRINPSWRHTRRQIERDKAPLMVPTHVTAVAAPSDDLLERAVHAYHAEYHRHWRDGGDAQDHDEAHRCGLEAVLELVGALPSGEPGSNAEPAGWCDKCGRLSMSGLGGSCQQWAVGDPPTCGGRLGLFPPAGPNESAGNLDPGPDDASSVGRAVFARMHDTLRTVLAVVSLDEPYPWKPGGALMQQIREDLTAYEALGLDAARHYDPITGRRREENA